jgi:ribosomal protein S18 acetylase RimI-like enzyme
MSEIQTPREIENDRSPILLLDSSRQHEAAGMLASAFFNDPLMVHYLPNPVQREKLLPGLMRASLRYCLFYGEVWVTADLAGAACWLPPGRTDLGAWGLIRAGLGVVPIRVGWIALGKVRAVEAEVDKLHHRVTPGPHWYLMLLAVAPERQGQGLGSRLIAPQLARAEAAGMPVYLETMNERDVAFYRKNGFEIGGEIALAGNGPRVWGMRKTGTGSAVG